MAGRARSPLQFLKLFHGHDLNRRALHSVPSHAVTRSCPPLFQTRLHEALHAACLRNVSSHASSKHTSRPAQNPDRGPTSKEDTQTDFNDLNVLGSAPIPTTSIDVCTEDGFVLDSGLKIVDGDGVILMGGAAFVWRPWMGTPDGSGESHMVRGVDLRRAGNGTGGLVTSKGLMEIPPQSWGILALAWPKPDLIIIGTGERIQPLEKGTRETLQQLGVRIEVLDTRNAASQFNLLATERGTHEVAAAMVPIGFGVKSSRR